MKKTMLFPMLLAVAFMVLTGIFGTEVPKATGAELYVVDRPMIVERVQPPPPPVARVEAPGPPPAPGYVWVPGYWDWNGRNYVWINGRYSAIRPDRIFIAGHWTTVEGGWEWIPGHNSCVNC